MNIKLDSLIPYEHQTNSSTEQLKDLIPIVKSHTALDVIKDRIASGDKTKIHIRSITIEGSIDNRYKCNNNFTKILASRLTSTGCKSSASWNWNFISGKTKCKMGQVHRPEGKLKPYVANNEFMGT